MRPWYFGVHRLLQFFFSCGCLQKGDGEAEEEGCDQLVIVVADVNDVVVVVVLMTTRRGLCMD